MTMIKKVDGNYAIEQEDIMQEVMCFYKNLMGTKEQHLKHIDIDAIRRGKQFSTAQRNYLISTVIESETFKALEGIGDLKAPGIDGYGAKFFKTSWNTVKGDVVAAVHEYFDKGNLYKAFNSTIITLIPKHENAQAVKDFRPITGCTTV